MDIKGNTWHFCISDKFLGSWLATKNITISLFEASETIRQVLARNSTTLLDKYGFRKKIFA
jgi:hypothetical protein